VNGSSNYNCGRRAVEIALMLKTYVFSNPIGFNQ